MSYKKGFICMKVIAIALFLLFFQSGFSQLDFSGVDGYLQRNQKILGNNLTALVYKDGKLVYQKDLGESNAKTPTPIAGASMWLTTALVLNFVDQGKINLDDPVSKYIPVFTKYMKSYVTIRHCLTNTTGIERENNLKKITDKRKFQTLEEEINALASKEISNNPGQEYYFGSYGFAIAARVCEIVGKKTFERLVQEKITRPLKMRGTSFAMDDGSAPNPGGGARSTANDYMNFLIMLMNKGMFEGKKILSEESVAEMQKIQVSNLPVKFSPKLMDGYDYSFGNWIIEKNSNDQPTAWACPSLFGTIPYIDRCRNYAAILIVNSISTEQKKGALEQFKGAVDDAIGECK